MPAIADDMKGPGRRSVARGNIGRHAVAGSAASQKQQKGKEPQQHDHTLAETVIALAEIGESCGTRTHDLLIKSQLLYRLS